MGFIILFKNLKYLEKLCINSIQGSHCMGPLQVTENCSDVLLLRYYFKISPGYKNQ